MGFCSEVSGMWVERPSLLWASDEYLYQVLGDACDQIFSWEEGLGPFRCYFYDLVYYILCLEKDLVAFYMILETKLFSLHGYCLWSLQALENYIWVAEWARLFSLFLRVSCVLV